MTAVTLGGNLTRDPELRYTTGGRAVVTSGLACNRRYQKNGEWQEQTSFFNVVCWGDLAENVAASLTKGARVIASGRLEQRSYETNEGEKRSVVEVVADEIGPSLRWATAEVARTEREKSDGSNGYQGGDRPSGGGGGKQGGGYGGDDYSYGDEEPFIRDASTGDAYL